MHRLHLGEIVGEEGRDDPLQEHPGAGMEEPQEVGHGKATPRPLLGRLAELGDDPASRERLCAIASAELPDEPRLAELCA